MIFKLPFSYIEGHNGIKTPNKGKATSFDNIVTKHLIYGGNDMSYF